MTNATRCPRCGNILAGDLGGKCPECLLQAAIAGSSAGGAGPETIDYASQGDRSGTHAIPQVGQDFGDYRLVRALGQGGMGTVFEAEERVTGRRLALKVLSHSLDSPTARQRFLREGRLAASVNHPQSVYVFGTEEIDGAPVITMELVRGGTLQERVRNKGPLPATDAADAILQVIDGLEAAHAVGVLHRDVKPSNCFVDAEGGVKIGDFGLSISKVGRGDLQLSTSGAFLGTPAFASPEQLRGDELDQRSDLYAVGVTLFYLLTGKVPFEADQMMQMVAAVLEKPAPDVRSLKPNLPKDLATVVARCLEKVPTRRFRSYKELRTALLPFSSLVPAPATPARRYAAGAIDFLVLSTIANLAALILAVFGADTLSVGIGRRLLFLTTTFGIWLAYYALPEGLHGVTVGKWVLGLRLVRRGTMDAPDLPRVIFRTLAYCLAPLAPAWIYSMFGPSFVDAEGQLDFTLNEAWTILAVSSLSLPVWAMLFVTMRRDNGFAAVHDLPFGLRVVARPVSSARPMSALAPPASDAVPNASPTFGPYHILAPLGENAAGEWKLGYDARLLRKVWLRVVPHGAEALPASVQGLSRSGRVRWLTGRRGATENWDGFEAPTGQPLWALLDRPLDWDEVRYLLLDLSEELAAALKDGTLPQALSLDRVWITADGRAKLSDLPVPGVASNAESLPTRPGCVEPVREFLHQVAVASLLGKRVSAAEAQAMTVARPLPLHARPILDGLLKAQRPEVVAAELRANLQRPARVTRVRRWGMFAALAGIPLAIALFSILRNAPNYIALAREPDIAYLKDALYRYKPIIDIGLQPTPEDERILEIYIAGTFGDRIKNPAFWSNAYLMRSILPEYKTLAKDIVARMPPPSPEALEQARVKVDPLFHHGAAEMAMMPLMPFLTALFVVGIFLWLEGVPSVLAALIFRGGPLWRIFGLVPVTADGEPASRGRFAWRQLIAWSPVFGFPILLALVTPLADSGELLAGLSIVFGLILFATIVASTFLCQRSLPDRLANTWLVMR